jgi:hypothetical protein
MKQSLTVIPQRPKVVAIAFYVALFCIGLTIFFTWSAVSSYSNWKSQIEILSAQNEVIQQKISIEQSSATSVPTTQYLNALVERVEWYNEKIPAGLDPVQDFLMVFEKTVSKDVKLNDFFYDLDGNTVMVSLLSASEQSLLTSLRQLQDEMSPMTLTLERQLSLDGVDQRLIQYDIRVAK